MYNSIAPVEVVTQMKRQFQTGPEQEGPKRPEPSRHGPFTDARLRMSAALHALANAIEPPRPTPECAPGQAR